jgi:hypothetical protein
LEGRQYLGLLPHLQAIASDLVVQDRVIRLQDGGREQRLQGLGRPVREAVRKRDQLVDVGTLRIELDGRSELAQRVIRPVSIQIHRAKSDVRVGVEHPSERVLEPLDGLVPTLEGGLHRIDVGAEATSLVAEGSRQPNGELTDRGYEL